MTTTSEKLTDKEEETMLLLWEHGPCTVKDLLQYYSEPRPHINTASSFVRSLEAKGYVGHQQGRYGSYNYFAIKSKSDYRRNAISKMIGRYFGNCFSMVSQLVEDEQIDACQLEQLLDMVKNKRH
ncbi:MAG: BlaI/MecI/CopY family transcriptional regulator [Paramuribaculum sp.]|nr:BlaI/MecI/CopY family transcriptional regulator [Paramuribaculum sp.]